MSDLVPAEDLAPWFVVTAVLIALALGGLHALDYGHSDTTLATRVAGSRASKSGAALHALGAIAAYTAVLFALGALTLLASAWLLPGQLNSWLGLLGGVTIGGLGLYLLLRCLIGASSPHSHSATPARLHLPLGLHPAALLVLLSALALHRVAFGVLLIAAFSIGLLAAHLGSGLARIYAPHSIAKVQQFDPLTSVWLPRISSGLITVLGLLVSFQAVTASHVTLAVFSGYLSRERLGPVLFLTGLGLILGMRHSTDPDHVVAISTIVSKQRSIRNAALIGSVWGLGHTIMIFAVGALIILAGMKIPPRVGLAMEFTVALMLVLLGSLNLTGVTQRCIARVTPKTVHVSREGGADGELANSLPAEAGSPYRLGVFQYLRPLVIGLVHGLAGSAAVALLVLSTIHNPVWATIYLLIFGFGTVLGMMIMTAAIAVPLTYAGDRFTNLSRYFGITSGVISMCFGLFLVYQLGFVGGLFTSHPHWTPQ